MSFWQQLRWRIVAVNMLAAVVGVVVVLVCVAVIMQTSFAVEQAEQASALQSETDISGIDIVIHESVGADVATILRQTFLNSIPIAVIIALVSSGGEVQAASEEGVGLDRVDLNFLGHATWRDIIPGLTAIACQV